MNCYLSNEPPITLIDTGTRWSESQQVLCDELATLQLSLRDIQRIIVTHPHPDHCGLAAEIVRLSKAEVWTHPANRAYLSPTPETRESHRLFYRQLFSESGVPEAQLQNFLDSRGASSPYTEAVETNHTLDEGQRIEFAGGSWSVYHTPGHSGGLICLFDSDRQVLLANDHILKNISSNPIAEPAGDGGPRPHRLVEYLFHLQRMANLHPQVTWTGHGPEIQDLHRVVRQRLRFHDRRANHILNMLSQQEMTAFQVTRDIFGAKTGFDSFLALSETIGHLDWLCEQEKLQMRDQHGVVYWSSRVSPEAHRGLD